MLCMSGTNHDLTCGTMCVAIVIAAVLNVAYNAVNMLAASALVTEGFALLFVVKHSPPSFRYRLITVFHFFSRLFRNGRCLL